MLHSTFVATLGVALLAAGTLPAQQAPRASREVAAGPRIETSAAGLRSADVLRDTTTGLQFAAPGVPRSHADGATIPTAPRQSVGKPVALMVVGGAAVVLGAVIGDAPGTLFMIGGTVAFLYGLYQYLQ